MASRMAASIHSLWATDESPDRLLVPEKLYGREREIEALIASFDRVVARAQRSWCLFPDIQVSANLP